MSNIIEKKDGRSLMSAIEAMRDLPDGYYKLVPLGKQENNLQPPSEKETANG